MAQKKYGRITMSERIQIEKLLALGKNYSEIAQELGRNKSSIKGEVDRCPNNDWWRFF